MKYVSILLWLVATLIYAKAGVTIDSIYISLSVILAAEYLEDALKGKV